MALELISHDENRAEGKFLQRDSWRLLGRRLPPPPTLPPPRRRVRMCCHARRVCIQRDALYLAYFWFIASLARIYVYNPAQQTRICAHSEIFQASTTNHALQQILLILRVQICAKFVLKTSKNIAACWEWIKTHAQNKNSKVKAKIKRKRTLNNSVRVVRVEERKGNRKIRTNKKPGGFCGRSTNHLWMAN